MISLKVSLAATILSIFFGIPIALVLSKGKLGGRGIAEGLINFPLVMPPTVLGYFLLVLFGRKSILGHAYEALFGQSLVFTWQGAALAASIASLPLLISQARLAFGSVDRDIHDSARVAGASEWQIFRKITLPLSIRGVAAGITLAFTRALGDFGATLMIAGSIPGKTRTMPLAIYEALQTGDDRTLLTFVVLGTTLALGFSLAASSSTSRS